MPLGVDKKFLFFHTHCGNEIPPKTPGKNVPSHRQTDTDDKVSPGQPWLYGRVGETV